MQHKVPVYITNIYLEMTPNPKTMKFVADRLITKIEGIEFEKNSLVSDDQNLVQTLLNFPFIDRIYVTENYLSITKNHQIEWIEIQEEIRILIKEYLQDKELAFNLENLQVSSQSSQFLQTEDVVVKNWEETPHDQSIIDILEEYVQPAVSNDGGEIRFAGLKDSILFVTMRGACNGCPSSTATLKDGIERLMHQMLPDIVKEVRAIV